MTDGPPQARDDYTQLVLHSEGGFSSVGLGCGCNKVTHVDGVYTSWWRVGDIWQDRGCPCRRRWFRHRTRIEGGPYAG